MRPRPLVPLALLAAASCGGRAPAPAAPAAGTPSAAASAAPAAHGPSAGSPPQLIHLVTPSRLFPELVATRGLVATEDGTQRYLVDRMRLVVRPNGAVDRAEDLFPIGSVSSIALPSRLGGGYLFHASSGTGTEIWRASSWLGKLTPLTRRNEPVADILPGFDRIYLRLNGNSRMLALDAKDGHLMGLGPLPVASAIGQLAFADGWRAVVDTDLRGPLATFDAGATWRPVGISDRVLAVGVVDGNPAVFVNGGRYLVDAHGGVSFRTDAPADGHHDDEPDPGARGHGDLLGGDGRRPSPLGKRPLRAAVEDGWPDSPTTAVVARGGALGRVSLTDGAVLALAEDAYPDTHSTCHAVRLGLHGVGFVCGEEDGPTTLYAWAPPLAMRPVLHFDKPRFVSASGNGALVVRGRCAADGPASNDASDEKGARWYCVRSPTGALREIRVKGFDLGVERVVGLGDGRIAVLVPPRGGSAGALSIIAGSATSSVKLALPEEPKQAVHELELGMWLEGFEERAPGVLGGWVEAGGPFVGVEITLDGKVKVGELRDDAAGGLFAGRLAVALGDEGKSFETTDGGMTWAAFDLPDRDVEARALRSRGCGPVGCALPGWVRVGWGDAASAEDMKPADSPDAPYDRPKVSPTLAFDCTLTTVATPPLPDRPRAAPPQEPRGGRGRSAARSGVPRDLPTPWAAFRNMEAPALASDDYAADNGPNYSDAVSMRAYAWGKRGSDWTRNGRWLVRFDDRFDAAGGVRQTAVTASPWAHELDAVDGIGTQPNYGSTVWRGELDPSGRALLASACHDGRGNSCSLYSIADGQPVLPIKPPTLAGFQRVFDPGGAVRVGETWFFLTPSPVAENAVTLWRADLGVARPLATYFRTVQRYSADSPRLTRRAFGEGVAIVAAGPADPGEKAGSWIVIPVDPETGALGEASRLIRTDFAGAALPRCAPEQDGWVLDLVPDRAAATMVIVDNAQASMERVEFRLRADPGRACIEKLAVRSSAFRDLQGHGNTAPKPLTSPPGKRGPAAQNEAAIPLAATEQYTGRRWGLACTMRKR